MTTHRVGPLEQLQEGKAHRFEADGHVIALVRLFFVPALRRGRALSAAHSVSGCQHATR